MMIMCKCGWIELSICLIIICHNLVIGIMNSIGFKSKITFILIFFLFFKNCNYDSTILGGAQPYVLVHQYMLIFLLWDLFHCFHNNISSKNHLLFRRKIFLFDQDMFVLVKQFSRCRFEHNNC